QKCARAGDPIELTSHCEPRVTSRPLIACSCDSRFVDEPSTPYAPPVGSQPNLTAHSNSHQRQPTKRTAWRTVAHRTDSPDRYEGNVAPTRVQRYADREVPFRGS